MKYPEDLRKKIQSLEAKNSALSRLSVETEKHNSALSDKVKNQKEIAKEVQKELESKDLIIQEKDRQINDLAAFIVCLLKTVEDLNNELQNVKEELIVSQDNELWEKEKGREWVQRLFSGSFKIPVPSNISELVAAAMAASEKPAPAVPSSQSSPQSQNGSGSHTGSSQTGSSQTGSGQTGSGTQTQNSDIVEHKERDIKRKSASLDLELDPDTRKQREDHLGSLPCEYRQISHDLGDKFDPKTMKRISPKILSQLIYHPPWFEHIDHIIDQAVLNGILGPDDKPVIITADHPQALIDGSPVSSSLMANLLMGKYGLGVPYNRQADQFKRTGYTISRQNMSNWERRVYDDFLVTVIDKMSQDMQDKAKLLCMDESPLDCLQVRRELDKTKSTVVHCATASKEAFAASVFHFRADKKKEFVPEILGGNGEGKGLHHDGAGQYTAKETKYDHYMCNAHASRRFAYAVLVQTDYPEFERLCKKYGEDSQEVRDFLLDPKRMFTNYACHALKQYVNIYHLEHVIQEECTTAQEREERRQKELLPAFEELRAFCLEIEPKLRAKSKFGDAVHYFTENYAYLTNFCYNGNADITNNIAEQGFKRLAIVRNNSLFFDSVAGAEAGCGILSIIHTCLRNKVDPEKYIQWVLDILSSSTINSELLDHIVPYSKTLPEFLKVKD